MDALKLGISACLLGDNVRYNGGHKLSRFCRDVLSKYAEYTPLCPEVEAGLGVPRRPIRLIQTDRGIRSVESDNYAADYTEALAHVSVSLAQGLEDLDGYILMQKSPSCGMERVKVYQANGYAESDGVGLFVQALKGCHPMLPLEEAGRLQDAVIRENFLTRIYVYRDVKKLMSTSVSAKQLLTFHAEHKYLLMAYDVESYRALGRMLSDLKRGDLSNIKHRYLTAFMAAIAKPVSRGRHVNVMQHLLGYLKRLLNGADRQELLHHIQKYQQGIVPLIVPLTLLAHHFRRFPEECAYVLQQRYLAPYPEDLGLRSNI